MFYKLIIECGHMGAGNGYERVWFIKGGSPLAVMHKARRLPGVKRKDSSSAVKLIREISREDYLNGIKSKRDAAVCCS